MSDPGVKPKRGFFDRIRRFFPGGDEEPAQETTPDVSPEPASHSRRKTVKEVAYWIGNRSPGTGTKPEVYRMVMRGEIEVVREDGTVYNPGGQL